MSRSRQFFSFKLWPVFHFNGIVTYRSFLFCVEVISSTLVVRKQRNTLRYDTIEVENRLKAGFIYMRKIFAIWAYRNHAYI
jgi:hypothetical protein